MSEHNGHPSYALREVVRLLGQLPDKDLAWLQLDGIRAEYRRRQAWRPGPSGDTGSHAVHGKGPVRV